jgi:Xaa-Pro dipeptidase
VANATIFTEEEYGHRLAATRALMAERQLDALLVFSPENIYYLTGLNHQGYFAFTMLVVTPDGPLTIVTRSMERATIASQAPSAAHETFHDDEEPVDAARRGRIDDLMDALRRSVDEAKASRGADARRRTG